MVSFCFFATSDQQYTYPCRSGSERQMWAPSRRWLSATEIPCHRFGTEWFFLTTQCWDSEWNPTAISSSRLYSKSIIHSWGSRLSYISRKWWKGKTTRATPWVSKSNSFPAILVWPSIHHPNEYKLINMMPQHIQWFSGFTVPCFTYHWISLNHIHSYYP